jgi:hypothetical protein
MALCAQSLQWGMPMAAKTASPRLTVKAFAEMLRMPAYEQSRVLYDQKYPKQQPQSFRTPYYQRTLSAIRDFYRSGNDPKVLNSAQNDLQNIASATRRSNNVRVLENFLKSSQPKRKLEPLPNRRYSATTGAVEVRLSPDLQALDKGERRIIYFNCRVAPITDEIATRIIEIAHWILAQNKLQMDVDHIEVIDLATGTVHKRKKSRPATIKPINNNAKIIETLWSTA